MKKRYQFVWSCVLLLAVVLMASSAVAQTREATISLGRDPEPPQCVTNPDGIIDITWNIEHDTTPNYVYFQLWAEDDPGMILDSETYPGSAGITVARQWQVPVGSLNGKYWARVEYWSFEAGNEANAEVSFYVCEYTTEIHATKYIDQDCDNILTGADVVGAGWWICVTTPLGDTYCQQADYYGEVHWYDLPLGDYTVYEVLPAGWDAIYPVSNDYYLDDPTPVTVTFFNQSIPDCGSPVTSTTWGMVKALHR